MKKTAATTALFLVLVISALSVPDYASWDTPQAQLAMPLALVAEEMYRVEPQIRIVDGVPIYGGQERTSTELGFTIHVDSKGTVSITGFLERLDEPITITRKPTAWVLEGPLEWDCVGTPRHIMPEFC